MIDMKEYQIDMERLFHKNQLIPRIKSEFIKSDINFIKHMKAWEIDQEFGLALMVQMALHKRTTIDVLVGILRKHFNNSQETSDEIYKCVAADLVDYHPSLRQFIVKWDISQDVQDDLDRYQFPLPMIVEPKEIKTNEDTGYFTSKNSVILKHNNHHEEDVCLDHLNKMNQIKLTINLDVVSFIENKWRNLDKPKPGEDKKEFQKRQRAFEKFDRTARDVIAHLAIADNEFYLTHKYDKRGRCYCQGYHVQYQGASWNKAMIEFCTKEIVSDT